MFSIREVTRDKMMSCVCSASVHLVAGVFFVAGLDCSVIKFIGQEDREWRPPVVW